jgi:hypothetical protein
LRHEDFTCALSRRPPTARRDGLAKCRGIGACTAVTDVGTVAAVDHGIPGVGVVVAVELIIPGVSEQLVVAAFACRDATDRIVISDDGRVVAGTATHHVVATVAGPPVRAERGTCHGGSHERRAVRSS